MRLQDYRIIFLSVALLSFFVFMPITESFALEITYTFGSGSSTHLFRDITFTDPTPPITAELGKDQYITGEIADFTIFDFSQNLDVTAPDFFPTTVVQPTSTSTVDAVESGDSTAEFNGNFEVTGNPPIEGVEILELTQSCETIEGVLETDGDVLLCWDQVSDGAARAKVKVSGFSGDLTFSDSIVSDNEADGTCFYPVIGALKITGTLDVQPKIHLSYANANFTGVTAGNSPFELGMYYKQSNSTLTQQFALITLPAITDGTKFIDTGDKTIKSKNSGDTGSVTGKGILPCPDGGWCDITDYQGEYVLGIDSGCAGGGGGGLVRPSLVVNALVGIVGGSGAGSSISAPMISLSQLLTITVIDIPIEVEQMILSQDSTVPIIPLDPDFFDGFDLPLVINDNGFVLGGFTNTLETQSLKPNTPVTMKFTVYESEKIQHFSFYTNLRDGNDSLHQSDAQILYNDGLDLQIVDPQGFFTDAKITVTEEVDSIKKQVLVELVFAKPMEKTDIIIRVWDPNLFSRDLYLLDAIVVVPEIAEETPTPTFEEPVIEELQSQSIPKWIKNNAAWWSDQQISDSDFVAGIEYLIKNGIINVPGVEVGTSSVSTEIPEWVKNNAGWWADSLITDGDFTEAMQWLVANGVIQI